MKVKLHKNFGIHKKGDTIEANVRLHQHLLKGGYVKVKEAKK